jgi:hypothetical protein
MIKTPALLQSNVSKFNSMLIDSGTKNEIYLTGMQQQHLY